MLRDLFMAALGAASGLGILVVITVALKLRENAEMRRLGLARVTVSRDLLRDEYVEHGDFD